MNYEPGFTHSLLSCTLHSDNFISAKIVVLYNLNLNVWYDAD